MYKALAYKEWLKVRWFVLVAAIVETIVLIYIFANLRAVNEYNDALMIWTSIIYKKYMFFGIIKFLPMLIGIGVAVAQYLPEVLDMKLKLTFHLPLKENGILFFLNMYGASILFVLFIPVFVVLFVGVGFIFPSEIVNAMFLTMIPWFLAGFLSYFFSTAIMIDASWSRRILLVVSALFLIKEFLINTGYGSYQPIIIPLVIITLLFNYIHMLSGLRFKRGAK